MRSPLNAASATFALNAELWLRRFLLVIFCSFSAENSKSEVSTYPFKFSVQPPGSISLPPDDKSRALRQYNSLNPHPERVRDELFLSNAFFDPRDLVQVKYEMLRRVREDRLTVSESASRFGLSRPTWYQAQRAWEAGGLPALLPDKRGPRRAHKLSDEVVEALHNAKTEQPHLTTTDLIGLVRKRFALSVHRRSIERALVRQKKTP